MITAQAMKDALGITAKPREVPVADSPAQARLRAAGRDKEADALASEDFSAGILGPSEVYEAWGSPTLSDPSIPDGHPQPIAPPKSEAARQARRPDEGEAMNAPSPEESAAEASRDAQRLRDDFRRHAQKQVTEAVAAKQSGDPARTAAAAASVRETVSLGRKLKERLGRL